MKKLVIVLTVLLVAIVVVFRNDPSKTTLPNKAVLSENLPYDRQAALETNSRFTGTRSDLDLAEELLKDLSDLKTQGQLQRFKIAEQYAQSFRERYSRMNSDEQQFVTKGNPERASLLEKKLTELRSLEKTSDSNTKKRNSE